MEFLDEMIRDRDMNLRIEEVAIPTGSGLAGKTLRESRIRDVTDALVLLGRSASIKKLRDAVTTGFKP